MRGFYALLFILVQCLQSEAKTFCLDVSKDTTIIKHSDKSRVDLKKGYKFKPLKRNKKKTYYLIRYNDEFYWIKSEVTSLEVDTVCENGYFYESGLIKKPEAPEEEVSTGQNKTLESKVGENVASKVVDKEESSDKPSTSSKIKGVRAAKKFSIHIGSAQLGSVVAGKGLHTEILNSADVRKDQSPIFQDSSFDSMFELALSYRPNFFKSILTQGTLGYRTTKILTQGVRNPVNNSGLEVSLDSLVDPVEVEFSYSSIFMNLALGKDLIVSGGFRTRLYFGLSMEYRLDNKNIQDALVCGTESCPFKITKKHVIGEFDQMAFSPVLGIDLEYKALLFGLNLDLNYTPTLKLGVLF